MSKYCSNCGFKIENAKDKFCKNCGIELKEEIKNENNTEKENKTETLTGMDEKSEMILLYLVPVIGLVAMFIKEKNYSEYSKFHYKQIAALFIVEMIVSLATSIFSFLIFPAIMGGMISIILAIYDIIALIKAYQGELYKIPVINDIGNKFWK